MAGSLNKVMLIGNLGADPEIRSFQNGGKVANLRIATSEQWKDRNTGERQERTEWHTVAIFSEGLVNVVERFLKKGSKVYIEGKLQTRKWQDQNGQDRYSTEVVLRGFDGTLTMLDGAQGGGGSGTAVAASVAAVREAATAADRAAATIRAAAGTRAAAVRAVARAAVPITTIWKTTFRSRSRSSSQRPGSLCRKWRGGNVARCPFAPFALQS